MIFTAESIEQLAEQFAQLPDIGRKTAHRLALYVVKMQREEVVPINRYETNLYNDTTSLRRFIDQTGQPNLKMLIDTFHMNIEEPDVIESILHVKDYISHVHFADSNRWAPGCGHLNFKEILKALKKIGYEGAISAEILPRPSQEECMKLTIEYYRRLGLKKQNPSWPEEAVG